MSQRIASEQFDVVVVGAGAGGLSAAIAASKNGMKTALLDSSPFAGGELVSGLPVDGCLNSRGEWIVGGVPRELFESLDRLGGYVGPVFDWRTMWGVCVDPELFKLAILETLGRHQIALRLYTTVEDVVMEGNRVVGVMASSKGKRALYNANVILDCSGDADVAVLAGAPTVMGGEDGALQPVSLVLRLGNVDYEGYLNFVRRNPDQFLLGENPIIGKTKEECAQAAYESGQPFVALSANGSLLGEAIEDGEMYPCTAIFVWPTAPNRQEVAINSTRLAGVDATDTKALSEALITLGSQVLQCERFCREKVPGFERATLTGVASRVGVRETRRIVGEYVLSTDDVIDGKKSLDGIAKGGHHVDVHGSGKDQMRIPITDGRSYDIPYGCLIPEKTTNVLVAGRAISSSREANGSARVMGQCMATGQAAGTAAALMVRDSIQDARNVSITELREVLKEQGAVLDGTE